MDILNTLKEKLNLPDNVVEEAKAHMSANGGALPDNLKEQAEGLLDKLPFGLGDKVEGMLGLGHEAAAPADADATPAEETSEEAK